MHNSSICWSVIEVTSKLVYKVKHFIIVMGVLLVKILKALNNRSTVFNTVIKLSCLHNKIINFN